LVVCLIFPNFAIAKMCFDTSMHNLSPYDFLCGDGVGGRILLKKRFVTLVCFIFGT